MDVEAALPQVATQQEEEEVRLPAENRRKHGYCCCCTRRPLYNDFLCFCLSLVILSLYPIIHAVASTKVVTEVHHLAANGTAASLGNRTHHATVHSIFYHEIKQPNFFVLLPKLLLVICVVMACCKFFDRDQWIQRYSLRRSEQDIEIGHMIERIEAPASETDSGYVDKAEVVDV